MSEIQRTDIEILDLFGREQGETAAPGDHAADVVPFIEVRGSRDAVAEPDARQHLVVHQAEAILFGKARQAIADERTLSRDGRWVGKVSVSQYLLDQCGQRQTIANEVDAGHRLVVVVLTVDLRRSHLSIDRLAIVETI